MERTAQPSTDPVDVSWLLRQLTADAGRSLRPEEVELIGLALGHLAHNREESGLVGQIAGRQDELPDGCRFYPAPEDNWDCGLVPDELRQLARQLRTTAGLADALGDQPQGSTLLCGAGGF